MGRDFKLTLSTKIKKVSSVKMSRHIIFHKRCLVIYNKSGLKCLKLPAQVIVDFIQQPSLCFLKYLWVLMFLFKIGLFCVMPPLCTPSIDTIDLILDLYKIYDRYSYIGRQVLHIRKFILIKRRAVYCQNVNSFSPYSVPSVG